MKINHRNQAEHHALAPLSAVRGLVNIWNPQEMISVEL